MSELYDKVSEILDDYHACTTESKRVLILIERWESQIEDNRDHVLEFLDYEWSDWREWFWAYPAAWERMREALPKELKEYLDKYKPKPFEPISIPEGWTAWTGGECPVGENVRVIYILRDGYEDDYTAGSLEWWWNGGSNDIVAYKVKEES